MKKILQVFPSLNRGGAETFVMNVYRGLDKSEYQFDFLVNQEYGDYREEILSYGGKIFVVPQAVNGWRKYLAALDKFFFENKGIYSAVHLQVSSLSNIATLFFAKKYGISIRIIHSHNSALGDKGMKRVIHLSVHYLSKLFVANLATHYLGCSDKALDWMFRWTGVRNRAQLIKNSIYTEDFTYNPYIRDNIRSTYKMSDKLIIGNVGRLAPVKNHSFLLDIFNEILQIIPNSELMLIGEGPEKENIIKKAADLGILDKIIFTGVRSDVNLLLQALDIIIMPSIYEGLPVCLIEAQASGLPLLLSDTISRQSKLIDSVVFKSLDDTPRSWAQETISLINKHHRTDTSLIIKNNGFDITDTVDRLKSIYNS